MSIPLEIHGRSISFATSIRPQDCQKVLDSAKTQRWLEGLRVGEEAGNWKVNHVHVCDAIFFGKFDSGKVGYVLVNAVGTNRDGTPMNGAAFLRGDSVAILPVLRTPDGKEWTVTVEQPRIPVGIANYREIPAGMVDEGEVRSKALDELREEVGGDFEVTLKDLTEIDRSHTSPGGSDEMLVTYFFERNVSYEFIDALRGRMGGLREEGESLRIGVVPLEDLVRECPYDTKAKLAIAGLDRYRAEHRPLPTP